MLSPITGHPLHTRSLTMSVYRGEDGCWLAKGDIIDLRKTGFAPMSTSLQPAGLIHHMKLELLLDAESLELKVIKPEQPVVAVERSEKSCGDCCRDPIGKLQDLVGEPLDADFAKKLANNFGGNKGCSHILALFHWMAATLPQAVEYEKTHNGTEADKREFGECILQRSLSVDGYQRDDKNIELALEMGDYLMRPEATIQSSIERLAHEKNLRLYANVGIENLQILDVQFATRERNSNTLSIAEWKEEKDWAESFLFVPIIPGFSAHSRAFCNNDPEKQFLQDALLQLAPGYIQIMASMADMWIASVNDGTSDKATKPMGGMPDSCYIWRSGGPLLPERKIDDHDLRAKGQTSKLTELP